MNPRAKKIIIIIISVVLSIVVFLGIIYAALSFMIYKSAEQAVNETGLSEIEKKMEEQENKQNQTQNDVSQEEIDKFDEYLNNATSNQTQNEALNEVPNQTTQENNTSGETSIEDYQGEDVKGIRVKELLLKFEKDITNVQVISNSEMLLSIEQEKGSLELNQKIMNVIQSEASYTIKLGNDGTIEGMNRIKIIKNEEQGF